jgi:hypothetical protein
LIPAGDKKVSQPKWNQADGREADPTPWRICKKCGKKAVFVWKSLGTTQSVSDSSESDSENFTCKMNGAVFPQ